MINLPNKLIYIDKDMNKKYKIRKNLKVLN